MIRWRAVTASAAGSLYFLMVFLWPLGNGGAVIWLKMILQSAGTLLMLQLAFGFEQAAACIRAGLIYGICALVMGGAMNMIHKEHTGNLWQILIPALILTGIGILWIGKERYRNKKKVFRVLLEEGGKNVRVTALMDSGNGLQDPISLRPVCVVHKNVIDILELRTMSERFRVIPYHSIGRPHGILHAWTVEKMNVQMEGQRREFKNVLLAESELLQAQYQMLLHPALLEEEKGENHDFKGCDAGKDAV